MFLLHKQIFMNLNDEIVYIIDEIGLYKYATTITYFSIYFVYNLLYPI